MTISTLKKLTLADGEFEAAQIAHELVIFPLPSTYIRFKTRRKNGESTMGREENLNAV
jgi:hypothetical protein